MEDGAVNFLDFQQAIWGYDADAPGFNFFDISTWLPSLQNFAASYWIERFQTPGGIISRFLPFIISGAALILFVMLIWGAFELLMGAANPKSAEAARQRITSALIGFFILFSAYWIAQIIQAIFGLNIGLG